MSTTQTNESDLSDSFVATNSDQAIMSLTFMMTALLRLLERHFYRIDLNKH